MKIYLSANIKAYRRAEGITQEQFGKLVGVSAQAVSKWERQETCPDITMLPVIASAMKVTIDELITSTVTFR